ncbi:MAG: hypothetical protein AB1505_26690 [Candidatus Latescibacterota bacterium]
MHGTLRIECLSDTCFSMPATLDVLVDAETCVDELGLPRVPGKTLHGLLRDTWLTVQPHFDPDRRLGHALLGEPLSNDNEGKLRIGDGTVDPEVRAWIAWATQRANPKPLTAAHIREGFHAQRRLTKVDRSRGAPETDTLRGVRVVPRCFVFAADLTTVGPLSSPEQELLKLLCQVTRHAGLDRNRGLGHVRLTVCWRGDDTSPRAAPARRGSGVCFVPYRLTLTAPATFRAQDLDPNSSSTLPFVPGTAVRGAVAAALVREGDRATLEKVLGEVRFLNAYPEYDTVRSLPTPITWQRDKDPTQSDRDAHPRDAALTLFGADEPEPPEVQPSRLTAEFHAPVGSSEYPVSPQIGRDTHQTRRRATGTTREGETTVFVYEALRPGQSFRGCLAGPAEVCERVAELMARGPLWLGRSARSEYGGAPQVEVLEGPEFGRDTELDASPPDIAAGDPFIVRLSAPAVLRDPATGQHDPWHLAAAVARRLAGVGEVRAACVRRDMARGYSRLWGTELPQLPCAAAGSVVLLQARRDVEATEVLALQAEPVGERTAEGYGRLVIQPATETLTIEGPWQSVVIQPTGAPPAVMVAFQRRLFRLELRRLLRAQARRRATEATLTGASPSLLQRLRVPLRAPQSWRATLANWLGEGGTGRQRGLPRAQREALEKMRIGNTSLFGLLRGAHQARWSPLDAAAVDPPASLCVVPAERAADLWNQEAQQLAALYLDTLLGLLAKRAKETRDDRGGPVHEPQG